MASLAGNSTGGRAVGGLVLLVVLRPMACAAPDGSSSGLPPEVAALVSRLLGNVGPEVVLPALEDYQSAATILDQALNDWASAARTGSDAVSARQSAQDAYREAAISWQHVEMLQLGPAGSSLTVIAGQDLRDEVYSWPTINPCRVDQETVEAAWDSPDFFTVNLVNSYGLDAVEHLLFAAEDNACPGQVDINADGTWDALGADGVALNRAQFAVALSTGVNARVADLVAAWSVDGGDFGADLAKAGEGSSSYESMEEGLNAVYDALFYLELVTKDQKLAKPLGLIDCADATCPLDVEGLASGTSGAMIRANLEGFRTLFTGAEVEGLDDLLDELGHGDLAVQIVDAADAAILAVDALDGPLSEAVDSAEALALHDAVKVVTDLVKGDLATVLTLQIPNEAAGDAD